MMVSSNIRRIREKKGISQAKLALALGVKENTVWRWENNKSTPNASTIVEIADILDSTPAELLSTKEFEEINQPTVKQEQSPADFSYWGGILNETRSAIARGNSKELALIETFLTSACDMIADSKKQMHTIHQHDTDKTGQHIDIHNNTMKAKNITVGTNTTGTSA